MKTKNVSTRSKNKAAKKQDKAEFDWYELVHKLDQIDFAKVFEVAKGLKRNKKKGCFEHR